MNEYTHIKRNFDALYDSLSSILILGSFPSVKSRQAAFYYGHPQNRFWKIMSMLLNCDIPNDIASKKAIMLQNHIALWDTIEECDIIGSSDSSIKNVVSVDYSSHNQCSQYQGYILQRQCLIQFIYEISTLHL